MVLRPLYLWTYGRSDAGLATSPQEEDGGLPPTCGLDRPPWFAAPRVLLNDETIGSGKIIDRAPFGQFLGPMKSSIPLR